MSATLAKHCVVDTGEAKVPLGVVTERETPDEPVTSSASEVRPRSRLLLLLIVGVAVVGGGGWYTWHAGLLSPLLGQATGSPNAPNRDGAGNKAAAGIATGKTAKNVEAARIETVRVKSSPRCDLLRLTGSLAADERSSVASNASGIAAEVRVDRGSLVRKGEVMVQIDPTDAKNKLDEGLAVVEELKARLGLTDDMSAFNPEDEPEVRLAKASANLAASNLKRAKDLYAKNVMTAEAFDQTQTEYELAHQRYRQALFQIRQAYQVCRTAEIKLTILKKALADTTIRAPFDGWVAEKLVAVGEQISSGMQATKVVTLVRIDPLRLSLTVPQQDIARIEPGQTVRFQVDSFPDRTFEARVRFIAPVVTNDTRSMVVEALAPNPNHVLRPGLFATAKLELPGQAMGCYVPMSAVIRDGEVGRVFVVRGGVARLKIVALGDADGSNVEIREGLTGNELLAAHPESVHDGDPAGP
jgi:RND family efflux transporter MFP subunit